MGSDPLWVEISPASQEVRESGQWFAELRRGTLSAAIQRLGWAEWEFDLANKAWRAVMAGDEEDDQDASQAAFDRLRAATDARVAALAEVRRLRPTPPEGTNG